jgi:ABC-2 type transport system permease protein
MTATTLEAPHASEAHRGTHVTFARVVRSEWIKLRSLRSSVWCYAIIVLLTIGFGTLLAFTFSAPAGGAMTADQQSSFAVQTAVLGVNFTQLVAAVLGVLIISGEYTTGMIRSTFQAVPSRLPAYFAKAVILAVTTFVVGVVSIAATALITAPILASKGVESHLTDPSVLLPMLGGAGYLALIAVLAFTFGAIIRSSAGGIATALGLVLVLPTVLSIVSSLTRADWMRNVSAFLPSDAGGRMFAFAQSGAAPAPTGIVALDAWQGLAVLVAWVVVFLAVGAVMVKRRDA